MPVAVVGIGEGWLEMAGKAPAFTTDLIADDQPDQDDPALNHIGVYDVWQRGSRVGDNSHPHRALNPATNWTKWADWLKAPNCRRAYDEIIVDNADHLNATTITYWESVIPLIGSNDDPNDLPSRVILFLAGNPGGTYTNRLLLAAKANPKVEIAIEGYHVGSDPNLNNNYDQMRNIERAWKDKLVEAGIDFPRSRVWLGLIFTDAPQYVATNPAYCAMTPRSRDCAEDAIYEWMLLGVDKIFWWTSAYSSDRSRDMAADATIRGIRRRYGIST